jgi:hypothetical protein
LYLIDEAIANIAADTSVAPGAKSSHSTEGRISTTHGTASGAKPLSSTNAAPNSPAAATTLGIHASTE